MGSFGEGWFVVGARERARIETETLGDLDSASRWVVRAKPVDQ